ncbi:MAG: YvcK family protein [Ardenticatenaceae bacterium]|nr:YvcK family protein [Ardenticatenaceae bacterium]MCB9446569.1 YvcK family protein [Ardenticatenaceae bacterium]
MQKDNKVRQAIFSQRRWFTLGIGLKRWLVLSLLGAGLVGMGIVFGALWLQQQGWLPDSIFKFVFLQDLPVLWRIVLPLFLGGAVVLFAIARLGTNLVAPFRAPDQDVVESLYDYSRRGRGPHIVAIGGGTGMPSLLRGLRPYTHNITAIVTVADDGGSSGRLREEFGLLPPGDFRNNLAALARDETLMTQVLQYRFGGAVGQNGKSELQGHAFGNLLLAALTGITGSFDEALLAAERVLALRGRVLPSTLAEVRLAADVMVQEGETAVLHYIIGESLIPKAGGQIQHVYLEPHDVRAYPPAIQAIFRADLIVMGPGSLYTSILPNLLVPDLAEALRRAQAPKIYVCNLAIQPGETDNYTVADHVTAILQHVPTGCLDIVLANDNLSVPAEQGGGKTIYVQPNRLPPTVPEQVKIIMADLVDEERPWRHDSQKLAQAVLSLLSDNRKTSNVMPKR